MHDTLSSGALFSVISLATCLWAVRGRLLHAFDILIACLRGMAGKRNIYLQGVFRSYQWQSPTTCAG